MMVEDIEKKRQRDKSYNARMDAESARRGITRRDAEELARKAHLGLSGWFQVHPVSITPGGVAGQSGTAPLPASTPPSPSTSASGNVANAAAIVGSGPNAPGTSGITPGTQTTTPLATAPPAISGDALVASNLQTIVALVGPIILLESGVATQGFTDDQKKKFDRALAEPLADALTSESSKASWLAASRILLHTQPALYAKLSGTDGTMTADIILVGVMGVNIVTAIRNARAEAVK